MALEYLYGTYGQLADSVVSATAEAPSTVLYVGTAPINLVRGYADAGIVNTPIRISNLIDAQAIIGDASDWDKYTLCEAIAAHFKNANGNIGPIYVINVLDPATHRKSAATTKSLNFVNGSASFESEDIILDTLAIAGKAEGTDYNVSYNFNNHKVSIISANLADPLDGPIAVTYNETDPSIIGEADIIGTKTETGVYTGMQAAELMYQKFNAVVNLFAAPKWSQYPSVYRALVEKATKLNGHWDGFVYADIPLTYEETSYSYEEVENPTPDSNPSTEGWYTLNAGVYTPSSDDHLVSTTYYTLSAETGTPSENPQAEDFYEKDGDSYVPTQDTTVDAGKTYYTVTATEASATRGDNPSSEGWYISTVGGYVAATDTYVVSGTTYYTADGSTTTRNNDTLQKAVDWKAANGYTSERSKVFFPKAQGTDGNVYFISTLALAETLRLDLNHDGVPYETCGNKTVPANKQYFGATSNNGGYDVTEANSLCKYGITTIAFWGGSWKIWGDHTAAYTFNSDEVDPRAIFDTSMRMLLYLTNRFQIKWAPTIDKPFTVQLKDTILMREQERLDALVAMGALVGTPKILFEEAHNTHDDIMNGNFRWDIQVTPTPPLKSATAYVAYTDAGLTAFF